MSGIWISSGIIPGAVAWVDGVFDIPTFILETMLCWLMLTLACYADEYGDFEKGVDNDARLGPITPTQRGLIDKTSMQKALIVLGAAVALVGLALVAYSWWHNPTSFVVPICFLACGAICIAAAYLYTMGKHPYGYVGLGDLAGFIFFGLVAVAGGFWLYGHTTDWTVLLPAAANGLLLAGSINLNNIRDIENDTACGKMTFASMLGLRGARRYQYALLALPCALLMLFPIIHNMTGLFHYLFVLAFLPIIKQGIDFCHALNVGDLGALRYLMKPYMTAYLTLTLSFCVCLILPGFLSD